MRAKPPCPRIYHRGGAPLAWWSCWEGAGAHASESIANVANLGPGGGVVSNFPGWQSGLLGSQLNFDGSHWADSGQVLLGGRSQATILVTFATPSSFDTSQYYNRLVSGGYNICGWGYAAVAYPYFGLAVDASGAGGNPQYATGSTHLQPSTLYRGAAVFDGTQSTSLSRVKLFVNGNAETVANPLGSVIPTTMGSTSAALGLGRDSAFAPSSAYNWGQGALLDVQIYSRVLSAAEIARHAVDPWWRLRRKRAQYTTGLPLRWLLSDSALGSDGATLASSWLLSDAAAGTDSGQLALPVPTKMTCAVTVASGQPDPSRTTVTGS